MATEEGRFGAVFAFPSPANEASNAICRRLGFELLGEADMEYPPGRMGRWNVWRLDLAAER
jgi:RimJ/RimL family protein N-acetyltransferase